MDKLDNLEFISKLDVSNMSELISRLPDQCREAYDIGMKVALPKIKGNIQNIVFAGLGGSAIGADIVRIYLQRELKVPITVNRNYTLPDFVGKNTLLFCSSYSGNTEETLSSFEDGLKRGAQIITMGSGGKIKGLSLKNGFKHITIPTGYPPRTAIGYMSITVIAVLARLGFIKNKKSEIGKLCSALSELKSTGIGLTVSADRNISKQLAAKFYGRYCIIYGTSDATEAVSVRWKGQIAENSKSLSSNHVLPEMNHNEIVGWEFPRAVLEGFKVVMLRDKNDHKRTSHRFDISKAIIKESGAEIFEVKSDNPCFLARIFSLIYIGDYVSFYLAILNNIDPTPVKSVDYLKSKLAEIK